MQEAFTEAGVWSAMSGILGSGLQEEGDRDDDTNLVVEMCLVLLRNVLAVAPGRQDNTRTHDDADLHDQVHDHTGQHDTHFEIRFPRLPDCPLQRRCRFCCISVARYAFLLLTCCVSVPRCCGPCTWRGCLIYCCT